MSVPLFYQDGHERRPVSSQASGTHQRHLTDGRQNLIKKKEGKILSVKLDITIIKGQIPLLQDSCIEQINKGYSSDKKYIVHLNNNRKFLLRLFDLNEYELKLNEFSCLEKMRNFEVKCSRPIEIGKLSQVGYMLLSFIDGHDALEQFPNLSDREQFNIGYEAGKELKKIHLYIAPKHISPWHERKAKKHKKYLDEYFACGMRIKNDDYIIKFIEQNIKLIKERPNVFQHDDFHVGNIIINDKKLAGVVDFNRYDWGDPIHEFLKVGIFSREVSIPFSIGQIKGYHNNNEPDELFWRLYSLYLAMSVFSTVIWTLKVIPEDINEMLNKIYMFLEDHNYFNKIKPSWYKEGY